MSDDIETLKVIIAAIAEERERILTALLSDEVVGVAANELFSYDMPYPDGAAKAALTAAAQKLRREG